MQIIPTIFILIGILNCDISVLASQDSEQVCDKESCNLHPIFDYQKSNVDWTDRIQPLWKWLNSQKNIKAVTFCKQDAQKTTNANAHRPLMGPIECSKVNGLNFVKFEGAFDQDKLLKGQGRVIALGQPEKTTGSHCFDILPSILNIHGRFVKGQLDGKATLSYNDDTKLEATFFNGVIHGKVRLFAKHDELQGIGLYEDGLPHGPFWFAYEKHYVQVHFDKGRVVADNVIMVEHENEWAMIGKLVNQTYLVDARKIDIDWIGDYKCMQVIRIPNDLSREPSKTRVKLPVKIIPMLPEQKIMVRPSKIMYFNRVAKTGSQSFIKLFKMLGDMLGKLSKDKDLQNTNLTIKTCLFCRL